MNGFFLLVIKKDDGGLDRVYWVMLLLMIGLVMSLLVCRVEWLFYLWIVLKWVDGGDGVWGMLIWGWFLVFCEVVKCEYNGL